MRRLWAAVQLVSFENGMKILRSPIEIFLFPYLTASAALDSPGSSDTVSLAFFFA